MRPEVWLVTELPINRFPQHSWIACAALGGWWWSKSTPRTAALARCWPTTWHLSGESLDSFTHKHALGYVSGLYGSQKFHRAECGLDPASIVAAVSVQ